MAADMPRDEQAGGPAALALLLHVHGPRAAHEERQREEPRQPWTVGNAALPARCKTSALDKTSHAASQKVSLCIKRMPHLTGRWGTPRSQRGGTRSPLLSPQGDLRLCRSRLKRRRKP